MRAIRSFTVGLLALAVGSGFVAPARAVTFIVNSVFDVVATPPLDNGVCETAPGNGVCTLRAAIMKANHLPGGGATIELPGNPVAYRLTIPPTGADDETTGDLNITAGMTITGAGASTTIVDGGGTDRVIRIAAASAAVTISGVTIRNGLTTTDVGGGMYVISGALTLLDSILSGNRAFNGGGIFAGPGSAVSLMRVTVTGNSTISSGGGVVNNGAQSMTIDQCVITDNTSGALGDGSGALGGGIYSNYLLVVSRTVIMGNSARVGGGIYSELGTAQISNSTIAANRSATDGGGMFVSPLSNMTIVDSTISANGAAHSGGGIMQVGSGSAVHLFHTTVAGNLADSDAAGAGTGGGIYRTADSAANEVWNLLLAENYAGASRNECDGAPTTSEDYNYIQTAAGCGIVGVTAHNVTGGDALLDGLHDNGGPTPTRALLPGSPALDRIPPALCRDALGNAPAPDQRGVARPSGALCDIGAFEGAASGFPLGRNLIRNGDAENGAGSMAGAPTGLPGWTNSLGRVAVVPYGAPGGFPSATTDVVPATHGYNFFAGGTTAATGATQSIALESIASAIDAAQIVYTLAGDFGGFATQEDSASLIITFRSGTGQILGRVLTVGNVSPTERGNVTGFRNRSFSDAVPVGARSASLTLRMDRAAASGYNDGYADNLSLVLSDRAGAVAQAIEYHHTEFDHYFITALPDEIAKLDAGVFAGWMRVGDAFNVLSDVPSASTSVCRFFSTAFGIRSSHFYTPDPTECEIVKQNADWQFEGNVFNVELPADDGSCNAGWQPVYRLYNDGQGGAPNHRYTTSLTVRSQMMDNGWIPEGSGIGVAMCAPM